jgi:hypothetical protein
MTTWSTPALLLVGIAVGPYGLNLLTPSILLLLDPGIAMAVAMLGIFVGLSLDFRRRFARSLAASFARTVITAVGVGTAALATISWGLLTFSPGPGPGTITLWVLALLTGVCAAVSNMADDLNVDDLLTILAGGLLVAGLREPGSSDMVVLLASLAAISVTVALAGWLLVGQTPSEGEQHVFVVGTLLLVGGAATYLSMSAAFAGLLAGIAWNLAGNLAKARIVRDLHYFQHPLVVLALITAGAAATVSVDAMVLAVVFVAARAVFRPLGRWIGRHVSAITTTGEGVSSLISAGLVGIALALDTFRVDARPEWAVTLLAAVVIGTIGSEALALFFPVEAATA